MSNSKRYLEDLQDKKMTAQEILNRWYPNSNYTESDVWDAIAEANGMDYSEIADGDLAEWL
jgi:hypothetical protein